MRATIVAIRAQVTRICVKEKEHVLLGGAYAASAVWHHSAILTIAYGVVALAGVHIFRRRDHARRSDKHQAVYHGRHLAD